MWRARRGTPTAISGCPHSNDTQRYSAIPQLAVADGGFASRTNERWVQAHGVPHVVLPRRQNGRRSRAARAALRWRTGSEGHIAR